MNRYRFVRFRKSGVRPNVRGFLVDGLSADEWTLKSSRDGDYGDWRRGKARPLFRFVFALKFAILRLMWGERMSDSDTLPRALKNRLWHPGRPPHGYHLFSRQRGLRNYLVKFLQRCHRSRPPQAYPSVTVIRGLRVGDRTLGRLRRLILIGSWQSKAKCDSLCPRPGLCTVRVLDRRFETS